jgi:ribosome maturation factor RimP
VAVVDDIARIVGPMLAERGLDLYDIEHRGAVLSLLVDRPGGVDLDTLSQLSRDVSRALDAADPIAGRYTLEVSSPGLERKLRTPTHFRGAIGSDVTMRVEAADGPYRLRGVLVAADDESAVVRADDLSEHRVAYGDVDRARTVFSWGSPPPPRARRRPEKKALRT